MKKIFLASLLSLFAASAYAEPKWACAQENWVAPPEMDDGLFKGTLFSDCEIVGTERQGFSSLDQFALEQTANSTIVHSGPTEETYLELPSVKYDVTNISDKNGDKVSVRSDVHVATDRRTRHVLDAFSTKVTGEGNGKYVRKVDISVTTIPGRLERNYLVRFVATFHIKKPPLIPGGAFKKQVESVARSEFVRQRDERMPDIASHL